MKPLLIAALMIALSPAAASAQSMTVDQFLARADALKARGVLALGSSEMKALRDHMVAIGGEYRRDLEAARAAGKPPHSCPPARGQARIGSRELLAEFERIPPARRSISTKAAFYEMMRRRYPCPPR